MRDFHLNGRSASYGQNGMVATSHPLSTLAALDVLRAGGNAVDAAITANAVQCVVEPQSTGIGGDCWVIYVPADGSVHALNSSGWAPSAATPERIRSQAARTVEGVVGSGDGGSGGRGNINQLSPHAVTVPGAPAGWQALLDRFGTLSLEELLQPAIAYAEEGYVVAPRVAFDWNRTRSTLKNSEAGRDYYLPGGSAPAVGDKVKLPLLAQTFKTVGKEGAASFYRGSLAEAMVASLKSFGALHEVEDFAEFEPEWPEPIQSSYRGLDILELPPNGQGITALQLLNMLENFDLAALDPDGAERYHLEAEATRLAFRDRDLYVADMRHAHVPVAQLLDKTYARQCASHIDPHTAMSGLPEASLPSHPDTIYLSIVDRDGNAISFINSIYDSFGSGLVCPTTGVTFHSRGRAFRLEDDHPNAIGPRKRPLHTIIPGMAMKNGRVWASFGVMGGDYQPVGHAHVIANMLDFGMDAQQAVDSARAMAYPGPVKIERGINQEAVNGLIAKGHKVETPEAPLGGGQIIRIDHERGVMIGGSDPRKDGLALGY